MSYKLSNWHCLPQVIYMATNSETLKLCMQCHLIVYYIAWKVGVRYVSMESSFVANVTAAPTCMLAWTGSIMLKCKLHAYACGLRIRHWPWSWGLQQFEWTNIRGSFITAHAFVVAWAQGIWWSALNLVSTITAVTAIRAKFIVSTVTPETLYLQMKLSCILMKLSQWLCSRSWLPQQADQGMISLLGELVQLLSLLNTNTSVDTYLSLIYYSLAFCFITPTHMVAHT